MAEQIDDNQERIISDAVQQFIDAQIEGQEPDMEEFVNKYPEFKHQIRKRISNVRKIDALFTGLTQAAESTASSLPSRAKTAEQMKIQIDIPSFVEIGLFMTSPN